MSSSGSIHSYSHHLSSHLLPLWPHHFPPHPRSLADSRSSHILSPPLTISRLVSPPLASPHLPHIRSPTLTAFRLQSPPLTSFHPTLALLVSSDLLSPFLASFLTSFHLLSSVSPPFTSSHISPHQFASFHLLSPPFPSSHPQFTSSPMSTSCDLFSQDLTFFSFQPHPPLVAFLRLLLPPLASSCILLPPLTSFRFVWPTLSSSRITSLPVMCSHISKPFPASYHPLSHILTSFRLFSPHPNSSHITSFHLISPPTASRLLSPRFISFPPPCSFPQLLSYLLSSWNILSNFL